MLGLGARQPLRLNPPHLCCYQRQDELLHGARGQERATCRQQCLLRRWCQSQTIHHRNALDWTVPTPPFPA
ncbi:unnamed protein product, partial [Ectocarpus sp. 13 AM-2016]